MQCSPVQCTYAGIGHGCFYAWMMHYHVWNLQLCLALLLQVDHIGSQNQHCILPDTSGEV